MLCYAMFNIHMFCRVKRLPAIEYHIFCHVNGTWMMEWMDGMDGMDGWKPRGNVCFAFIPSIHAIIGCMDGNEGCYVQYTHVLSCQTVATIEYHIFCHVKWSMDG